MYSYLEDLKDFPYINIITKRMIYVVCSISLVFYLSLSLYSIKTATDEKCVSLYLIKSLRITALKLCVK